jgi:exodeoxyribonuclease V alpha subunit
MTKKDQEHEIGVLKSIRYQGDNGFIIAQFEYQDKRGRFFNALGNILQQEVGLAYKLYGKWDSNSQYGKQFRFDFYEVLQPTDTKGIYQYLVRVCKWIGPTVAGRIVDQYRADALDVLKNDPARVAREINGITRDRAEEIQKGLQKHAHVEKVLVELERIFSSVAGIRKSLPMEIVAIYGSDAVVKIKENPYRLTRLNGVGFMTADRIAMALGFDQKAVSREKAAAWHVLMENMGAEGSVWAGDKYVKGEVKRLTGLDGSRGLTKLLEDNAVVKLNGGADLWAIAAAAQRETDIAEKIGRMVATNG